MHLSNSNKGTAIHYARGFVPRSLVFIHERVLSEQRYFNLLLGLKFINHVRFCCQSKLLNYRSNLEAREDLFKNGLNLALS